MKLKKGFTLAEALVTLVIIGVVAAITIPPLVTKYKKTTWIKALRVNYQILNQGFTKMVADNGVDFIWDTDVFSNIKQGRCQSSHNIQGTNCKNFLPKLYDYFKIDSIGTLDGYKFKYMNGTENIHTGNAIKLANGAIIISYSFLNFDENYNTERCKAVTEAGGKMCAIAGDFTIDINGLKEPNTYGRDIFEFLLTEKGRVVPYAGNDFAIYYAYPDFSIQNINIRKGSSSSIYYSCVSNPNAQGAGCSGYLIDVLNWEMNY